MKAVQANLKNADEGSGKYFPILAANQFTPDGKFINGIYVPHIAALQFEGPYEWKQVCRTVSGPLPLAGTTGIVSDRNMSDHRCFMLQGMTPFTFDNIKFKVGPFKIGPFNIPPQGQDDGKKPFFKILYVDEDILCAVGRTGGVALWSKASKTLEMEKGLNL